jgi:hypothetical protein
VKNQRWAVALGDTLSALALVAWVGGHVALGAFAARIVFRDLPRMAAAPTMNAVFRSFDKLILGAMVLLLVATILRALGAGLARRADRLAFGGALALVVLGAFEVLYVNPKISELFEAGRTLELAFASLHALSSRCANVEIALTALTLGAMAWARPRAS